MCYVFITYQGQKYALHESDSAIHYIHSLKSFKLMPEFSLEERAARREENNERIEKLISESWSAEKERRKSEKPNPKWSQKVRNAFLLAHPPKKYAENTKDDWDKRYRQQFREQVERENPPLVAGDFKNPLECKEFQRVILAAFQDGVPEEVLDLFVKRLVSLRRSSESAAEIFFEYFAVNPTRLHEFALYPSIKKNVTLPAISLEVPWHEDLMRVRLFTPRNTGKGELGAFALFGGDLEILSTEEKGDLIANKGTPDECIIEVKSVEKRSIGVRLGSEFVWSDSDLFKWLMSTPLKNTDLKKYVSRDLLVRHKKDLEAAGMTIQQFLCTANDNLQKVLSRYDKLYVYIEDEKIFEELQPWNAHFFGVSTEGRWKFTPGPNTLFQNV